MKCPVCQRGELLLSCCTRFPICKYETHAETVSSAMVLLPQWQHLTVAVFDTETTGLSKTDKIIEFGAVKLKQGKEVDTFESLCNPQQFITPMISQLTGIRNQELTTARLEADVLAEFLEWMSDVDMWIAHNLTFDARMVKQRCIAHGFSVPKPAYELCTLQLAKRLLPSAAEYTLGALAESFSISLTNAHRAVHDARATAQLFSKLCTLPAATPIPLSTFSKS